MVVAPHNAGPLWSRLQQRHEGETHYNSDGDRTRERTQGCGRWVGRAAAHSRQRLSPSAWRPHCFPSVSLLPPVCSSGDVGLVASPCAALVPSLAQIPHLPHRNTSSTCVITAGVPLFESGQDRQEEPNPCHAREISSTITSSSSHLGALHSLTPHAPRRGTSACISIHSFTCGVASRASWMRGRSGGWTATRQFKRFKSDWSERAWEESSTTRREAALSSEGRSKSTGCKCTLPSTALPSTT